MSVRVIVREGQPLKEALRWLKERIRREAIDDRARRHEWRDESHEKPGYRRRQQKFFAKVEGRKHQRSLLRYGVSFCEKKPVDLTAVPPLTRAERMNRLMPSDIVEHVCDVLASAHRGKGSLPNYLTAFQILARLPDAVRRRLIEERTLGGSGSGVSYAATSVVSDAAERVAGVEIEYVDNAGTFVMINGDLIQPSYPVCGIYRLRGPASE